VGSKLRERNILPRQFREQGGDGGVKFSHLEEHSAILRSNVADALDTAQSRTSSAFDALPAVNSTICSRRLRRSIRAACESDFPAVIDDGHAVAEAFGFLM